MQGERREDGCLFFFFLSTEGFIGFVRFLSFFFFNSLIFFSFFIFFPADLGVRCVCKRSMVEISLLVEEVSLE